MYFRILLFSQRLANLENKMSVAQNLDIHHIPNNSIFEVNYVTSWWYRDLEWAGLRSPEWKQDIAIETIETIETI